MFADDPKPKNGELILVAALTALATTLCTKLAERVIDKVWPPKESKQ